MLAGVAITALPPSAPAPPAHPSWPSAAAAALFGLLTWVGVGVDFPGSSRRFSRLV